MFRGCFGALDHLVSISIGLFYDSAWPAQAPPVRRRGGTHWITAARGTAASCSRRSASSLRFLSAAHWRAAISSRACRFASIRTWEYRESMARDTGPAIFMITASPAPDSASGDAFKTLFDAKGFSSPIAGATSPSVHQHHLARTAVIPRCACCPRRPEVRSKWLAITPIMRTLNE